MIGGMCGVVRDVIPYGIAHGNRSVLQGLNLIGLRRKNIPNKEIITLSNAYKEIFKNENLTENLNKLSNEFKNNELVKDVIEFKLCPTFDVIVVNPALALTPLVTAKPTRLSLR